MINVAIMGHGVVGSGVAEILLKDAALIENRTGEKINIKYILDLREFKGLSYSDKFITDFSIIENDPEVKIVAEVMGGVEPAYDFVKRCLKKGKSVCTSNKELVATKGYDLLQTAEENKVSFLFEASVGGGIPIIRPMTRCLAGNEFLEITGILNGTTNFILTKMIHENMSFDKALKMAQDLGYAERDPSADVNGGDACRKICILAALAFGKHVYPEQISCEGITEITLKDVAFANDYNCVIKLIGRAKRCDNGKITAAVYPSLISNHSQLAGVDDVNNAIMVKGSNVGEVMFYGPGAGKLPTASAVVGDIIECMLGGLLPKWADSKSEYIADITENTVKLYVYGSCDNKAEAIKEIEDTFPHAVILKCDGESERELAFITDADIEKELTAKLKTLINLKTCRTMRVL